MIDIDVIKLENEKEYIIISRKKYNDIEYLYLSGKDDDEDICVRKIVEDSIVPLDSEEELMHAINLFK